ncbi:MAG: hypothetical protein AVDCRST_MAG87-3207, partial [uncultured Thermomicrobiales bacterium]
EPARSSSSGWRLEAESGHDAGARTNWRHRENRTEIERSL